MKRKSLVVILILFGLVAASGADGEPDFSRILAEIDELANFTNTDFSAVYTIISERPGEEREVTQARLFRRDENDQFLILINRHQII